MLSRLFAKRPEPSTSRTPSDCVVWTVGDIHGRDDLADRLIQAIRDDLFRSSAGRKVIVFLGDYVDRGRGSKAVLDQLIDLKADTRLEVRCIRGNHEDRLEAFLTDPMVGPGWCDYGGLDTLAAYGVQPPEMRTDAEGWAQCSQTLVEALPATHRSFLKELEPSVVIGDYFFCHAGARPGVPLADQTPADLMWIRETFLDHSGRFEHVVVHGHTPMDNVVSDSRRIGLDTGAYATNVLSAVRLEGETRVLVQATGRGDHIQMSTAPLPSPAGPVRATPPG